MRLYGKFAIVSGSGRPDVTERCTEPDGMGSGTRRPLSSEAARTLGGQSSGLAAFLCLFQAHRPRSRLTDPPAAFIIELSTRRGGLP